MNVGLFISAMRKCPVLVVIFSIEKKQHIYIYYTLKTIHLNTWLSLILFEEKDQISLLSAKS